MEANRDVLRRLQSQQYRENYELGNSLSQYGDYSQHTLSVKLLTRRRQFWMGTPRLMVIAR
jgi:hypothetical protein